MPGNANPRRAIVGIGNELRGDDRAGLEVARRLLPIAAEHSHLLVIEAGTAPENFSGPLRRFNPEVIVLVDAAEMGAMPGTVLYLDWRETRGYTGSSHTQSIASLAAYLESQIGCEVWLLGIQPSGDSLGDPLSKAASEGVNLAVENLREWLRL